MHNMNPSDFFGPPANLFEVCAGQINRPFDILQGIPDTPRYKPLRRFLSFFMRRTNSPEQRTARVAGSKHIKASVKCKKTEEKPEYAW